MTDHKAFVLSLPREMLSALNTAEDAPGLRHLAGHLGLILFLGCWIAFGWPLWQLALVVQGIAICFLFTLEHEATHKTPFKTVWINEWVGRICGLMIFLPFEWFRYFHLAHHRFTNIPGKDPELIAGAKPEGLGNYIVHITGIPYWVDTIDKTIGNAFGREPGDYVPERARVRVRMEAKYMLVIYGVALASLFVTQLLWWVWLLPCLLGQPFLRLYLLAEHGRCAFVANMFENTRTTYTNRIVRFLAWNMPYHVEHHTLPQVPFHKLPDLHDHMQGHHQVTSGGYREFTKEYLANLR
ncbi:Delta(12)-fatty-acid desaturase [Roseovarius albus]|uniref:Delta(12)-fatty-acid desaturase n=1 Tax=Roseovarius albus TaxID=1247867 RepID=A0A1X6ZTT2_9RHOB|nr:fatty acid desaturase [Roseovarius albus]SLN61139.1 Delta(12)-fatty-acid desaturase [Roseovarius albus]